MKLLGIVGGLGPESTVDYYRMLIQGYSSRHNGRHPELLVYSADLAGYLALEDSGDHQAVIARLSAAIDALSRAGADLVLIASNTPHRYFSQLEKLAAVPLLSIVASACAEAQRIGLTRVGLFGTAYTMSSDFYQRVFDQASIAMVVPNADEQTYIHTKTMEELEQGQLRPETREGFLRIAARLKDQEDIQGLVLGCTEHPLLLDTDALGLRFLNTSRIHVNAALAYLEGSDP
jgi:aspartate racemase